MRIRKNIKHLSQDEKNRFVNAIIELKNKPSILHPSHTSMGRYDDYVEIHMNAMMAESESDPRVDPNWHPGWAHQGPAFFPWHRELLLQFEHDLQAIDSTVTIPYWDWADRASWPFTSDFMGSDGDKTDTQDPLKVKDGPFAFDGPNHWTINMTDEDNQGNRAPNYLQRGFGREPTAKTLPRRKDIQRALNKTPYDSPLWKFNSNGFRSLTEYRIHNLVHRWVNGTMVLMASPNDPVFWLHHCNIDRLWGDWQRAHTTASPYLPASGATLGHNLNDTLIFNTSLPPPWTGSATPASLVDHNSLGYSYETDPPIPEIAPLVVATSHAAKATKLGMVHTLPVFPLVSELRISSRSHLKRKSSTRKRK